MNADDSNLWLEIAKTVKPLKKQQAEKIPASGKKHAAAKKPVVGTAAIPASPGNPPSPLPQRRVKQLRQQKVPIEKRLDLHGYTVERAHQALLMFIRQSMQQKLRCVEIVTGRGDITCGTGQLRRFVPLWLEDAAIKNAILHVEGNPASRGGSLLVLLRRDRTGN